MSLPELPNNERKDKKDWMVVATTAGLNQAAIIAGRLESLGVPVFIHREAIGAVFGLTLGAGAAKVLVPQSHYDFSMAALYPDEEMLWLTDGEDEEDDDLGYDADAE